MMLRLLSIQLRFLIFVVVVLSGSASAAPIILSVQDLGTPRIKAVPIRIPNLPEFRVNMEIPPIILPGGYRSIFFSSGWSYLCHYVAHPFLAPTARSEELVPMLHPYNGSTGCAIVTSSMNYWPGENCEQADMCYLEANAAWALHNGLFRRATNYNGVYGAALVPAGTFGSSTAKILAVTHQELKNEVITTVAGNLRGYRSNWLPIELPTPLAASNSATGPCASGELIENGQAQGYQECWRAYWGSVGLAVGDFEQANQWGLTPFSNSSISLV